MSGTRTLRIAVPGAPSRKGNWITAERWSGILRKLGHEVQLTAEDDVESGVESEGALGPPDAQPDLLIALHAKKTFTSIEAFHREHPDRPLIVTLTGTDLYRDVARSQDAQRALGWADRLIVLQPGAFDELAPELRRKARLIRQSCTSPSPEEAPQSKSDDAFDVCVIGHLRDVKDPFRAAEAARLLPEDSKIQVLHAGAALTGDMERRAVREMEENPRYRWLGEISHDETQRLLVRSHVLAHTSRLEGGANAMSEALVAGTAVVSSRVAGSVGMLGDDHPAYFKVGDAEALARLLRRCETDSAFLAELEQRSRELAPLYEPAREEEAWGSLLGELAL